MAKTVVKTVAKTKAKPAAKSATKAAVKSKSAKAKLSKAQAGLNKNSKSSRNNKAAKSVANNAVVNKPLDVESKASASNWFLYMLECADGRVYTGITTDVERRFAEHSSSGPKAAKALRGKGPLKLVFQQAMDNRSKASIAESAIKKLSKADKRLLIQSGRFDPSS